MLCKPLIIRVFAPEGDFVRKYALIFRGRVEDKTEKSKSGYNLKVAGIGLISTGCYASCGFRFVFWLSALYLCRRRISLCRDYMAGWMSARAKNIQVG